MQGLALLGLLIRISVRISEFRSPNLLMDVDLIIE